MILRIIITVILTGSFLSVPAAGAARKGNDHSQTIRRLAETEESFDVVSIHYQTLMRTAEDKGDERIQAECLFQLARINYWQGQFSLSLAQTKQGLSISHRLNDKILLAMGYDLLARLHYMFSPEQAQYYYRKCWQYSEQTDSAELSISILNNFNMVRKDKDVALDELFAYDKPLLSPLTRTWLYYHIARALLANGRTGEATVYLGYMRQYLQHFSEASALSAMYEYLLGQLKLIEGDTKQAWEHAGKSMAIVRKNRLMQGMILNYNLASQIAQAEKNESLALNLYKKSIALQDSIFNSSSNLHFPDELINTMMDYITGDRAQAPKNKYLLTGIWFGLILLAGACLLYYFKSAGYYKKSATAIANIREHKTNTLHSGMKNHLMKIMFAYKAGVSFCLKQKFNAENPDTADDIKLFEKNIHTVDRLMDSLIVWVESNPDMTTEKVEFDVTETVKQMVAFYEIGFAFKSVSCRLSADRPVMVRGDKYMFAIALEHLFFSLFKVAAENTVIHISVSEVDDCYAAIGIADPENKEKTLEKKIFSQRIAELETNGITTYTADRDFNIFAECTIRNRSKARIECTPEKGTVYHYMIPL